VTKAAEGGVLVLAATPIGNIADASPRLLAELRAADVIAAEDTRRLARLLDRLGVTTEARVVSYFDGNEARRTPSLVDELAAGQRVLLVTDAGMPSVSDPGYRLVTAAVEAGVEVQVVPGPSAVVAALVLSGLPTDRFSFEGFPSRTAGERRARLAELAHDPRTLVFFESPRRVATLLREIAAAWGTRRVAVCRELTKVHEEVLRGTAEELAERLAGGTVRGEVVVVIEGDRDPQTVDMEAGIAEARDLVVAGARKREAAHTVSQRTGLSANGIYRALLDEDV
jgi:16S rRNA (cytidine1402-2'-O)-methyltransferase